MPFETLGELLGGGGQRMRDQAYQDEYGRAATGEAALERARGLRDQRIANERLGDALQALELDPALAAIMQGGHGNFQQFTGGLGNLQERDFRGRAADPSLSWDERQSALMGVASGPVRRHYHAGGEVVDLFDPEGQVRPTGLGEALIGQREAQAGSADALRDYRIAKTEDPERFRAAGAAGQSPAERAINAYLTSRARHAAEREGWGIDEPGQFAGGLGEILSQLGMHPDPADPEILEPGMATDLYNDPDEMGARLGGVLSRPGEAAHNPHRQQLVLEELSRMPREAVDLELERRAREARLRGVDEREIKRRMAEIYETLYGGGG